MTSVSFCPGSELNERPALLLYLYLKCHGHLKNNPAKKQRDNFKKGRPKDQTVFFRNVTATSVSFCSGNKKSDKSDLSP